MPDTLPSGTDLDLCYITLGGTRYSLPTALGTMPYKINVASAPLVISGNSGSGPAVIAAGTLVQFVGTDATTARVEINGFGGAGAIAGTRANGTSAAPTAEQSGQGITQIQAFGYGATGYASAARAGINLSAAENWTDTAQGSFISFSTSAVGAASATVSFVICSDKSTMTRGVVYRTQAAPTALTTSATLTAAQILGGLLTANQGGGATAAYQLPLGTDLEAALPAANIAVNDSFEFSLINISTVAAEDVSITTNTDWTLVGNMDIQSNDAATSKSVGRFRVRRTAAHVFTLYRIG